jgi:Mce-associated membrane protein
MSEKENEDVTPAAAEVPESAAKQTTTRGGAQANRVVLAVALIVVAVAALVITGVSAWHIVDKRSGKPDNLALVDQATTQQVISQVSADAVKIFSYNYANAAASQQAAESVLLDPGRQQYLTLLNLLKKNAAGQQLTLVVKIIQAGVTNLTSNVATVLVFLDQTSTRASDKASSTSAAQVQLGAVKSGGVWKINRITTF